MFTMKVLLLCLTVTVVLCEYEQDDTESDGTTSLTNCYLQSNMSIAEFRKMVLGNKNNNLPITQPEKCFVDCMMKATNMFKNGKISVDVMIKSAVSFYGRRTLNKKLIYKRVEELINGCVKKVSDQSLTEECAVAAAVYTCMMEESQKAGLADRNGRPVTPQRKSFDEYISEI